MARKLTKKELNALIKELHRLGFTEFEIYLFGSTAKGQARADSDRDFCLVFPDKERGLDKVGITLTARLGIQGFDFDLILTSATDFRDNMLSPILHEVRTTGIKVA